MLKKIHVPGEELDRRIRVYGHIEIGKPVDYL
ncbi:hypothetical protein SAMN05443252_10415 [Bacillus sp. OV322]|nr:hypothetical protein SAMN05443252_10415 [Bacillus sp. OV322]